MLYGVRSNAVLYETFLRTTFLPELGFVVVVVIFVVVVVFLVVAVVFFVVVAFLVVVVVFVVVVVGLVVARVVVAFFGHFHVDSPFVLVCVRNYSQYNPEFVQSQ